MIKIIKSIILIIMLFIPIKVYGAENINNINNIVKDSLLVASILFPTVFMLNTFFRWLKNGNDKKSVIITKTYLPEELNSLEVAFIYNGLATERDLVSLIIYLANKGYLKIIKIDETVMFSKSSSCEFIKLKEYDGIDKFEKQFFNILFENKNSIKSYELKYDFRKKLAPILEEINEKENKNTVIEKKSTNNITIVRWQLVITFIIISLNPIFMGINRFNTSDSMVNNTLNSSVIEHSLLMALGLVTLLSGLNIGKTKKLKNNIFLFFIGSVLCVIAFLNEILPVLMLDIRCLIAYIYGLTVIILMFLLLRRMPKKTDYGNKMYIEIEGFKLFLTTLNPSKLIETLNYNPNYLYEILPFAYVLDVYDKLIDKFKTVTFNSPDWYEGEGSFNIVTFGKLINDSMGSITEPSS